jgi:excisionase family DNA binding protein
MWWSGVWDTDWVCRKTSSYRGADDAAIQHHAQEATSTSHDSSRREVLLVSRGEAAQLLSISQRGLDYLIANRRLPTRRIGGRVLIPVADLRKYVRGDHPESIVA